MKAALLSADNIRRRQEGKPSKQLQIEPEELLALLRDKSSVIEERDQLARWIVRMGPTITDHACAQCVPGGEIVHEGFQCTYHLALDIDRTRSTLTKPGEQS